MKYNELDEWMEPESIEEFAEVLVNTFANGNCSRDICPFFQDACEEIWPDEENEWCNVIEFAKSFNLKVDFSKRKKHTKLRKVVRKMIEADRVIKDLNHIKSNLTESLREIDNCKRFLDA